MNFLNLQIWTTPKSYPAISIIIVMIHWWISAMCHKWVLDRSSTPPTSFVHTNPTKFILNKTIEIYWEYTTGRENPKQTCIRGWRDWEGIVAEMFGIWNFEIETIIEVIIEDTNNTAMAHHQILRKIIFSYRVIFDPKRTASRSNQILHH